MESQTNLLEAKVILNKYHDYLFPEVCTPISWNFVKGKSSQSLPYFPQLSCGNHPDFILDFDLNCF